MLKSDRLSLCSQVSAVNCTAMHLLARLRLVTLGKQKLDPDCLDKLDVEVTVCMHLAHQELDIITTLVIIFI